MFDRQIEFHPDGFLFIADTCTLVASDIHLEKGSYFARKGNFLPPHDSRQTLEKLYQAVCDKNATRLILLGDSYHDCNGQKRLNDQARDLIELLRCQCSLVWIAGNHDPCLSTETEDKAVDSYVEKNFIFQHIARARHTKKGIIEVSGHYHPKVTLWSYGRRITGPCFVVSENRILMPASGAYTGGLDIMHPEIQRLFPGEYKVVMCGKSKTHILHKNQITEKAL